MIDCLELRSEQRQVSESRNPWKKMHPFWMAKGGKGIVAVVGGPVCRRRCTVLLSIALGVSSLGRCD